MYLNINGLYKLEIREKNRMGRIASGRIGRINGYNLM